MKLDNVTAAHAFEPAPEERAFRFANGSRARSLVDFAQLVRALPDHVLDYHRAHFEGWLRDVVGDPPLAERARFYAESDMATDVYRRIFADLVEHRLDELRHRPDEVEKPPRRATLLDG